MGKADDHLIRVAQVTGTASNLRGLLRRTERDEPGRIEQARAEWPELWERIDAIVELVDWG